MDVEQSLQSVLSGGILDGYAPCNLHVPTVSEWHKDKDFLKHLLENHNCDKFIAQAITENLFISPLPFSVRACDVPPCFVCEKTCDSPLLFLCHMYEEHMFSLRYQCLQCETSTSTRSLLKNHISCQSDKISHHSHSFQWLSPTLFTKSAINNEYIQVPLNSDLKRITLQIMRHFYEEGKSANSLQVLMCRCGFWFRGIDHAKIHSKRGGGNESCCQMCHACGYLLKSENDFLSHSRTSRKCALFHQLMPNRKANLNTNNLLNVTSKNNADQSAIDEIRTVGDNSQILISEEESQQEAKSHDEDDLTSYEIPSVLHGRAAEAATGTQYVSQENEVTGSEDNKNFKIDTITAAQLDTRSSVEKTAADRDNTKLTMKEESGEVSIKSVLVDLTPSHSDRLEGKVYCPQCNLRECDGFSLTSHMLNDHSINGGNTSLLKNLIRIQTCAPVPEHFSNDNIPNCFICGSSFNNPSKFQIHMQVRHCLVLRFECPTCRKSIENRQLLKQHHLTHSKDTTLFLDYLEPVLFRSLSGHRDTLIEIDTKEKKETLQIFRFLSDNGELKQVGAACGKCELWYPNPKEVFNHVKSTTICLQFYNGIGEAYKAICEDEKQNEFEKKGTIKQRIHACGFKDALPVNVVCVICGCSFPKRIERDLAYHIRDKHNMHEMAAERIAQTVCIGPSPTKLRQEDIPKCFLCHDKLKTEDMFEQHLSKKHCLTLQYECPYCFLLHETMYDLNKHFNVCPTTKKGRCLFQLVDNFPRFGSIGMMYIYNPDTSRHEVVYIDNKLKVITLQILRYFSTKRSSSSTTPPLTREATKEKERKEGEMVQIVSENVDCFLCDCQLASPDEFEVHIKKEHNVELKWKCPYCSSWFDTPKCMTNHLVARHELLESPATVTSLGVQPNFVEVLKGYSPRVVDNKKCEFPDFFHKAMKIINNSKQNRDALVDSTPQKQRKETSSHKKTEVPYKKKSQEKHSTPDSEVKTHPKVVNGEDHGSSKCPLCDMYFTSSGSLATHISEKHDVNVTRHAKVMAEIMFYGVIPINLPKPKRVGCLGCSMAFTDPIKARTHVGTHGIVLRYKCPYCSLAAHSPKDLAAHLVSQHHLDMDFAINYSNNTKGVLHDGTKMSARHELIRGKNMVHVAEFLHLVRKAAKSGVKNVSSKYIKQSLLDNQVPAPVGPNQVFSEHLDLSKKPNRQKSISMERMNDKRSRDTSRSNVTITKHTSEKKSYPSDGNYKVKKNSKSSQDHVRSNKTVHGESRKRGGDRSKYTDDLREPKKSSQLRKRSRSPWDRKIHSERYGSCSPVRKRHNYSSDEDSAVRSKSDKNKSQKIKKSTTKDKFDRRKPSLPDSTIDDKLLRRSPSKSKERNKVENFSPIVITINRNYEDERNRGEVGAPVSKGRNPSPPIEGKHSKRKQSPFMVESKVDTKAYGEPKGFAASVIDKLSHKTTEVSEPAQPKKKSKKKHHSPSRDGEETLMKSSSKSKKKKEAEVPAAPSTNLFELKAGKSISFKDKHFLVITSTPACLVKLT